MRQVFDKEQVVFHYFNIAVCVPNHGWLATDDDGDVNWFEEEPTECGNCWDSSTYCPSNFVMTVDLEGKEYQNTLRKIESPHYIRCEPKAPWKIMCLWEDNILIMSPVPYETISLKLGDPYMANEWHKWEMFVVGDTIHIKAPSGNHTRVDKNSAEGELLVQFEQRFTGEGG